MMARLAVMAWALAWAAVAQEGLKLEQRSDSLWYVPGQTVPYSGRAGETAFNGAQLSEAYYRKGIQHGAARFWFFFRGRGEDEDARTTREDEERTRGRARFEGMKTGWMAWLSFRPNGRVVSVFIRV